MADPKEAKAAAPPADAAAKKPGSSKLVIILLAVNTLLTGGVLAYQFLRPAGGAKGAPSEKEEKAHAKAAEAKANAVGPTIRLADFTVHLRDTDADHYARVTFDLEVATDEDKNRVSLAIPRLRDVVIAYLADRSFDELRGSDALVRTKEHLLEKIKQTLPGTVVKGLYISDIVVQ